MCIPIITAQGSRKPAPRTRQSVDKDCRMTQAKRSFETQTVGMVKWWRFAFRRRTAAGAAYSEFLLNRPAESTETRGDWRCSVRGEPLLLARCCSARPPWRGDGGRALIGTRSGRRRAGSDWRAAPGPAPLPGRTKRCPRRRRV